MLKKFEKLEYISLMAFPGTKGSVIYLKNYLSTMFQISDVLVDKEEVAMSLNIKMNLPDEDNENAAEDKAAPAGGVRFRRTVQRIKITHGGSGQEGGGNP